MSVKSTFVMSVAFVCSGALCLAEGTLVATPVWLSKGWPGKTVCQTSKEFFKKVQQHRSQLCVSPGIDRPVRPLIHENIPRRAEKVGTHSETKTENNGSCKMTRSDCSKRLKQSALQVDCNRSTAKSRHHQKFRPSRRDDTIFLKPNGNHTTD